MAHAHDHTPSGGAGPLWGIIAEFDTPATLTHAAEKCRDAGFRNWDVYAPFPVHGMDEAMGLRPSRLPWIMGACCLAGFSTALSMQWWMSSVDYPIAIGGKPMFAWEQFTPIMFELSVLFSAFGGVFGMLILNRLPQLYHPLMKKERFLRVSDDRFCIAIESADPKFDPRRTREFLESIGGRHVDTVEE